MTKDLSNKIIQILADHYGAIEPALDFISIYQLTIAVVLSAQTTDKQVNSVTPKLFERYPDFRSLSKAPLEQVEKIVKSTGFYKNKAKHIISLSKRVVETYNGTVPDSMEELITLDGVGRKSANIILSSGYNKPGIAVDTHVIRISNRLGYIDSKNPLHIEKKLNEIIPIEKWKLINLLFITHGRQLCKARNPLCGSCPIIELCPSANKSH
ncbi:MAG: endonuclease III [bacterium]|nr:endonuclease III [bacterium]